MQRRAAQGVSGGDAPYAGNDSGKHAVIFAGFGAFFSAFFEDGVKTTG